MSRLLIEALSVGLIVIAIGYILHIAYSRIGGSHDMNNMWIYVAHLFIIGVVTHIICELTGLNGWYCRNGFACSKNLM